MITSVTCSWCHTSNVLSGGPVYCRDCGHRADVCRLDCDCPQCRACRVPTEAEAEALARDFPEFVRRAESHT